MSKAGDKAIVFVHGIWMKGFEFFYLAHHLKQQGYKIYYFTYRSLFETPEKNAEHLYQFISRIEEHDVNLVAHSLGGIVVTHMLATHNVMPPGKVVMIGTPVNGSAVAKYFLQRFWLRWLLGGSIIKGVLGDIPCWDKQRKLCMIAGNKGIGIGRVLAGKVMEEYNDGTVNLSETSCEFCDEYHVVPHGHFAMLWSKQVVIKISQFLAGNG